MISHFRDDYDWLSNMYLTPVTYEGLSYPSSEHAYQAAKTTDSEFRQGIAMLKSPHAAKRVGKYIYERPDWKDIRVGVMRSVLSSKFAAGSQLAQWLLDTGTEELVEGNWWHDDFWGVPDETGIGKNWLGILLMERRDALGNIAGRFLVEQQAP